MTQTWTVPGVPFGPAVEPMTEDLVVLVAAVERVLEVDSEGCSSGMALARAEGLLAVQERLHAASLQAVADVDARELWALRASGSTRTWLRTLPCGERGQLAAARALAQRPLLTRALGEGSVSLRTVVAVARLLDAAPATAPGEQVQAVLVDGLGDLLGVWTGAACLDPTAAQEAEFEVRRERLARAVRAGLTDCWGSVADQLEPAFVVAAEVLAASEVEAGLGLLVDALQPEAPVADGAEQVWRERDLVLRKLKTGGWSLRAHLTDETGQLLHDALSSRRTTHPLEPEVGLRPGVQADGAGVFVDDEVVDTGGPDPTDDEASDPAGDEHDASPAESLDDLPDDVTDLVDPEDVGALADGADPVAEPDAQRDRYGDVGSGQPLDGSPPRDGPVEGTPLPSLGQRDHDAFTRLLVDALNAPRSTRGRPARVALTVTARLDTLRGEPGAPPGQLQTRAGPVALTPEALRRLACGSRLSAVLLDAIGRPLAASGEHRHATARERRAMRAAWGSSCAVNGCASLGTVPHHASPYAACRQTALGDLVPVCEGHHHDVHDGRKTLRLRDGRLIDGQGWVDPAWR